jgi:hypothetical protein
MQDAIPRRGFHRIKVHDLIGSISAVSGGHREKLWREFFFKSFTMVGSEIREGN